MPMRSAPAMPWDTSPACSSALGRAGDKPTLPFVYSDEVWTGIEYEIASYLIHEGFVEEGLTIVKALRGAMTVAPGTHGMNTNAATGTHAQCQALPSLAHSPAFVTRLVDHSLFLSPKLKVRPFVSFFSTASGFGTIAVDGHNVSVNMIEGELAIEKLLFTDSDGSTRTIGWKTTARPNAPATKSV